MITKRKKQREEFLAPEHIGYTLGQASTILDCSKTEIICHALASFFQRDYRLKKIHEKCIEELTEKKFKDESK